MTFQDDLNRFFAEANERLARDLPRDLPALLEGPAITIRKSTAFLPLSVEQQLDAGLITEEQARVQGWTPYVAPPVPWHRRLRWRWQAWRERVGRRAGGWIAGVDLSEGDEDW